MTANITNVEEEIYGNDHIIVFTLNFSEKFVQKQGRIQFLLMISPLFLEFIGTFFSRLAGKIVLKNQNDRQKSFNATFITEIVFESLKLVSLVPPIYFYQLYSWIICLVFGFISVIFKSICMYRYNIDYQEGEKPSTGV